MTREQVLKLMCNHVLQLKSISEKAKLIKDEMLKLSPEDVKWYEVEYCKWLREQGFNK